MIEIERKFLVTSRAYQGQATLKERIVQGFLNTHPERTVRVRIKADSAFLTVKGKSNEAGTMRFEWEKEIPVPDAERLLSICEPGVIDKVRYNVPVGQHIFEVDEFYGDNKGLVVAEIELASEDEDFEKPEWLGQEVTGEVKYYNSQLGKNPYTSW
ncbi:CYTH domain-containing protein [Zobellia galactanivorans]|uniref:CYTH family protein n=1 Tax=Zobellia galactanivorans (strain DSM 12802 / CCUG 47099 / CIP 106680 / NCIMB 13871 / Dsij) TaxID=63186 RepID=G0LAU6_ZOBGA|nr:CYTH domain-containing protein [Zobellia galactanivorans]MBU3027964.1 CYTH domain-containing protein [Zobellia galactanivorans]CAZ95571.1 CYTH family protein [Zobellia galactanivorans]